ncbi:spore protease YyaC [Halobacillus sp. Marseille-Q1614]|uniref:spore protease YyaC n=1 Tax=Halobacillus sp. Marseille-Q1614 TaxID=2709134 RepID=UPI00156F8F97|nr:spore protease YyaC [Halobacillus sp. Marseille-Q1614]
MSMKDKFTKTDLRFPADDPHIINSLSEHLHNTLPYEEKVIIICIGTDRSTGDALGPLVGSMLSEQQLQTFHVYGTLEEPVHALNLKDTLSAIETMHASHTVLAIDACLGKKTSIGHIVFGEGALTPGAALKKDLPAVGDYHISGMVNVGGFMEYAVLQNTRLHVVMNMAAKIAAALKVTEKKRISAKLKQPPRTFITSKKEQR